MAIIGEVEKRNIMKKLFLNGEHYKRKSIKKKYINKTP